MSVPVIIKIKSDVDSREKNVKINLLKTVLIPQVFAFPSNPVAPGLQQTVDESNPGTSGLQRTVDESNPGTSGLQRTVDESNPATSGLQRTVAESNPETSGLQRTVDEANPAPAGLQRTVVESNPEPAGIQLNVDEPMDSSAPGIQLNVDESNPEPSDLLWSPQGRPMSSITANEAKNIIATVNRRTLIHLDKHRNDMNRTDTFKVDRINSEMENVGYVKRSILKKLRSKRILGKQQGISNPNNIYLHSDSLNGGPHDGKFFYKSRNVGHAPAQTIPRCLSNGLTMADAQFAEALFDDFGPILDTFGFNVLQFIQDSADASLDPNLLMYLLVGFPQGFNGPFESYTHKNYNIDSNVKTKLLATAADQQAKGEVSKYMSIQKIKARFPAAMYAAPVGAVLHNSQAKIDLLAGRDARYRSILDDSAETPSGWSINSCMRYTWMHKVAFVSIDDLCIKIIKLKDRLTELGFTDHTQRVNCWKDDQRSAYRIVVTDPADHWLATYGLNGAMIDGSTGYVIDTRQQFGSRGSVTNYDRLAYAITSLKTNVNFVRNFYPQLGLPARAIYNDFTKTPPPFNVIKEDLKTQRHNPHGQCDPLVGVAFSAFLDDTMDLSIDVREDPFTLPTACAITGIRNPCGKAHANLVGERFKIERNLKKMVEENGIDLCGKRTVTILGFDVNLDTDRITCTPKFAASTITYLDMFINNPYKPQKQKTWSSMSGKINCAMYIYYQIRCYMRDIWQRVAILEWNGSSSIPSHTMIKNLIAIRNILTKNSGRSIRNSKSFRSKFTKGLKLSTSIDTHDLISDSSTSYGIGFVNVDTGEYYFRSYTALERELLINDKIFIGETIATFLMFMANRHHLHYTKLNLWGDNEGLVQSFHKCGSVNRIVDALMRIMVHELVIYEIDPVGEPDKLEHSWLSTKENIPYGDALSRNDPILFLEHFKSKHPNTNPIQLTNLDPSPSPQIREAETLLHATLQEHKQWLQTKKLRRKKKRSRKSKK